MAAAQGQIGEGRRGWAEISKDPQRYGVYSLPTGPYVVPLYATRFMSPLYLCQSRGNPALAPTALPSILGVSLALNGRIQALLQCLCAATVLYSTESRPWPGRLPIS
jgi:hypothetical protein